MAKLLLNSAMIPNAGTFCYRVISHRDAQDWLRAYAKVAVSYIGYQQTLDHLRALHDEPTSRLALNRAKCTMQPGDEALVRRLAYRVDNPATKGEPQPADWEYGILTMESPNAHQIRRTVVVPARKPRRLSLRTGLVPARYDPAIAELHAPWAREVSVEA